MAIHVSVRPAVRTAAALIVAALILTLGIAPLITAGADHLDAPSLGSASVSATDVLSVSKVRGQLDINDVYVFDAADGRTVLAMTVNPAVNLIGPRTFKAGAEYRLNVDRTGDAVSIQHYTVKLGDQAVASGFTNDAKGKSQSRQGVRAFAGVRSDPFFFDLIGFL